MSSLPTYFKKQNLAVMVIGAVLVGFIVFLLLFKYYSEVELRRSGMEQMRLNTEKHAVVVGHIFAEQKEALKDLRKNRELSAYFENKALGMSLEYGLRDSVFGIAQVFDHYLNDKKLDGDRIFTRIVFLESRGAVLVDRPENRSIQAKEQNLEKFLAQDPPVARIIVETQGSSWQVMISIPYFFKDAFSGQIVAWISSKTVCHYLIKTIGGASGRQVAVINSQGEPLCPPGGPGPEIEIMSPQDFQILSASPTGEVHRFESIREDGSKVDIVALRVPIPDTPFFLVTATPAAKVLGRTSPRQLLAVMAILALIILGSAMIIVRGNIRNQVLQASFEEAAESRKVLEDKNRQLEQEIGERQLAEWARQQSEERYRLLVKQIPAVVFKGYADWSVDFFDNKIETLTGYSKEEFDSRRLKWCELILPEDLEQVRHRFINGIKTGGAYSREYRIRKKDGRTAWIQAMGQIFYDTEGKLDYVSGVFFDITERKRAEEDLRQSEARLAEAQRIAKVGSWEWNLRSNRAIWSEELFRIFNLPTHEYGLNFDDLLQYVHPNDRESLKHGLAEARGSGKPFSMDYRIILGDGSPRYIHASAEIITDEAGEPALMRGTAQDVTARVLAEQKLQESNERFAAVFENAAIGICVADAGGRLLAANPSFQEMLGYSAAEMLAKTFPDITHPEDLPKNLELFQEMMTGKRKGFQLEKRYLRKTGELFWGRVIVSLIKDAKGQPLYCIAAVEDIDQCKKVQEKLQESERNLRYLASQLLTAQERERRRISSELHDELGHTLLTLKLNLRAIERELNPDQQALAEEIESLFYDLDEVIENVRRLYLDLAPGDIEDLGLTLALRMLIDEYARNNQDTQWSVDLINIDNCFTLPGQTAIYRIFQEILTNIGKHADPSLVSVRIKESDNRVFFEIEDNGRGFPSEEANHYRKRGVGLLAMEERVRMLGGSLAVLSQKDQGTRITFSVPFSEGGKID